MQTIHVNASKEYDVVIGNDLLKDAGAYVKALGKASSAIIISDDIVFALYGEPLKKSLEDSGLTIYEYVFEHGEKNKNLSVYGQILEYMCSMRLTRSDLVIALGGGVTGDMAGFAAATYQRGIRFVQIPTTLLAAVDSSVGGKTAVDLEHGKNQVGAFWQPSLVLCDIDTFQTLPEEQFICGCAEVIKYGVIGDENLFRALLEKDIREQLVPVIAACVTMKRDIVEEDEFDTGKRMLLNFGHTFGHAAEACSRFSILHGQAVAMGMAVMARAAYRQGRTNGKTVEDIEKILKQYKLPDQIPYDSEQLMKEILTDKKLAGKNLRVVIPERIGQCVIESLPVENIEEMLICGGIGGKA